MNSCLAVTTPHIRSGIHSLFRKSEDEMRSTLCTKFVSEALNTAKLVSVINTKILLNNFFFIVDRICKNKHV